MTDIEKQIIKALEDWQGWPAVDWLVSTVARRTKRTEHDVNEALKNLYVNKIVAKLSHKDQIVFRLE